jgi:LmbE family N-acetylglucosaminyl deacetylase
LTQAGSLATGLAVALPLAGASAADAPPPKIVVAGGHPGDPEYGCGGTVARCTDLGCEVVLLYLNQGDPSVTRPEDASDRRVKEAKAACDILKARPLYAGQVDGRAVVDPPRYEQFRKLLEAEHPQAVFTHWPIDNHADHRAISMLVYDAWVKMGKRFSLFYYEVSNGEDTLQFAPTDYVNIAPVAERKRQACYAHASQAPDKFYTLQETVSRWRGLESHHPQAEAFIRQVQSPDFRLPTG